MIIAIPIDETKENVCVSFGRAPYFLFHDTDTNTSDLMENPAASAPGGAGIQSAQLVVDKNASVLITVRLGDNAANVLKAAGVSIYKSNGASAAENIAAQQEGKLAVLESFHPGFHGKA